jgi:acetyltransferase-like isoleucine patch superfamily enzyme
MVNSFFKKIAFAPGWLRYQVWYFKNKSKFKVLGYRSFIQSPLKINGHRNIEIGNFVFIGYKTWLAAVPAPENSKCILKFGDGCSIGNLNHIYATKKIEFGKKVLTADKVYISDNTHSYENVDVAIIDQPVRQIREVHIGDGSWLGENVCIIGVSIGKNCVIGANSVVTKDIPDYSVAVGNPARVIKRYNFDSNNWQKTKPDGTFE